MSEERVLFVDDEPKVLEGIKRSLHKKFEVFLSPSGANGLKQLDENGPFAVVISDMQMPEMNGVEFLSKVRDVSPHSIRIMLTGNSDQQTAVTAINKVDVFKFLNKPCERDQLVETLNSALNTYRSARIERDLLENTLKGSVGLLSQVLSLTNPEIFGQSQRLAKLADEIAQQMGQKPDWTLDTAALLSHIGCISASHELMTKIQTGGVLSADEHSCYQKHLQDGAAMLRSIPRLEQVADIIQCQRLTGSGDLVDATSQVPLYAHILRVCHAVEACESAGLQGDAVIKRLETDEDAFDPAVYAATKQVLANRYAAVEGQQLTVAELQDGMILMEDIRSTDDVLLVCRGWETTEAVRKHLRLALENGTIKDSICVAMT